MKQLLIILSVFTCVKIFSQDIIDDSLPLVKLLGTVVYSSAKCDKSPLEIDLPGFDIHNEESKTYPYANQVFYIYSGGTNDKNKSFIDQVITDAHGNFSCDLPRGKYSIQQFHQHIYGLDPQTNEGMYSGDFIFNMIWMEGPCYEVDLKEDLLLTFHFYQLCPPSNGPDRM